MFGEVNYEQYKSQRIIVSKIILRNSQLFYATATHLDFNIQSHIGYNV